MFGYEFRVTFAGGRGHDFLLGAIEDRSLPRKSCGAPNGGNGVRRSLGMRRHDPLVSRFRRCAHQNAQRCHDQINGAGKAIAMAVPAANQPDDFILRIEQCRAGITFAGEGLQVR